MERKPTVAVVFHHIGPYHHARLNAAAEKLSVIGIEWSAKVMTSISLDDKGPELSPCVADSLTGDQ